MAASTDFIDGFLQLKSSQMRKNIKAGIKLFLRIFFDRFRKPHMSGFASHPESFEGNQLSVLLFLLLMACDLNRKIFMIGAIFSIGKGNFYCCY